MFMIPFFCGFVVGCIVACVLKPSIPNALKAEAKHEKARLEVEAQKLKEEALKKQREKEAKDFKDIMFAYAFDVDAQKAFNALQSFFNSSKDKYKCYKLQLYTTLDHWYNGEPVQDPYVMLSYRIIGNSQPIDFDKILPRQ